MVKSQMQLQPGQAVLAMVLDTLCKKIRSTSYFCRADAQAAADKLHAAANGSYHKLDCTIEKVAKFSRGRPAKGKPRTPVGYEYQLHLSITPDPELVEPLRMQAGCFVLVSNLDNPKDLENFSAGELLRLYKNQDGIERNFSFLKDQVIVNSILRKLIENAFTKTLFFPKLSTEQLDTLSKYPNTFICGN